MDNATWQAIMQQMNSGGMNPQLAMLLQGYLPGYGQYAPGMGGGQYNMWNGQGLGGGKGTSAVDSSTTNNGYDVTTTQKLPRQGSGMSPEGLEWWQNTVQPMLTNAYNSMGGLSPMQGFTSNYNPMAAPSYNYSSPYNSLINTLQGNYQALPSGMSDWLNKMGIGEAQFRSMNGMATQSAPGQNIAYQNSFDPNSIRFNQSGLGQTQLGQAAGYLNDTASGKYLGMDNPELNRVQDAISKQYMDNAARLMGSAKQGFSANFMGNSSNAAGKLGMMASDAAKDLGNTLATQRMSLYENERARQEAAAGQLGTLGQGMGQLGYQNALANLQAQVQAGQLSNEQAAQMLQGQIAQGQLQQGNLGMAADIMQNDVANQRFNIPLQYQYNQSLNDLLMNQSQFNASQQQNAAGQNQAAQLQLLQLMQNPMAYFQQSWNYGDKNNLLASILGGAASIYGAYMGAK